MQFRSKRRQAHVLVSGISLGLLLCGVPMLAQSGSDSSGSSGGTTSDNTGTTQNRNTNRGSDFNPAWLGLLGLAGLAGLAGRRKPETHEVSRPHASGQHS